MFINGGLAKIWKEPFVTCCTVLTKRNKNKKSVSMPVGSPLKIEDSAGAFQIQVNIFTATSAC